METFKNIESMVEESRYLMEEAECIVNNMPDGLERELCAELVNENTIASPEAYEKLKQWRVEQAAKMAQKVTRLKKELGLYSLDDIEND